MVTRTLDVLRSQGLHEAAIILKRAGGSTVEQALHILVFYDLGCSFVGDESLELSMVICDLEAKNNRRG